MLAITAFIREHLSSIYAPEEVRTLTYWIIEHVCGLSLAQQLSAKDSHLTPEQQMAIQRIISRLERHEPIQYVLGECSFYGLMFYVNPSVLIPRPETGELVEHILNNHRESNLRVLDIGTGSGCIAITLAQKLLHAQVFAIDISPEAIATAERNARRNGVEIHFQCADLFDPQLMFHAPFDLIISNPPYVRQSEKSEMSPNVLDYEPHTALFVPDDDPLLFYRCATRRAKEWLAPGGRLYFEINAALAEEMVALLREEGYSHVCTWRDMQGRERFAAAQVSK